MEIKYTQLLNAIRGVEDDKNVPENIVLEALTEAVAKAFKKDSELQDIEVKAEINKKSGWCSAFFNRRYINGYPYVLTRHRGRRYHR